ncbi:MAG TPA: ATP-grasp domain-containing protein, partial [Thermoleophilia bacterium]|nr:ATP-grasp domain-containing protein [Thermoleophilia bacterium]
MARLLEYQGKRWLEKAGLPVPRGREASTPEEARQVAEELGKPVAVKAQVQAGGRGKSGAVKLVDTPQEAEEAARSILNMEIKGLPVRVVLVEEKLDIVREYYATCIVNSSRGALSPMLMFSVEGGMDIESVPEEKILRHNFSEREGLPTYDAVDVAESAGIPPEKLSTFASFLHTLAEAYIQYDCFTLEINPMVETSDGKLYAADCKMEVDNSAVFRHPEFGIEVARDFGSEPTELD